MTVRLETLTPEQRSKLRAQTAEYRARTREHKKEQAADYRKRKKEQIRVSSRRYAAEYRARPENRTRIREYNAEYQKHYQVSPEQRRKHWLRGYGLTPEDHLKLVAEHAGKCGMCKRPMTKRACIDHCHKTGKARGLLCDRCNLGLGHYEREGFLEEARAYLDKYR